MIPDIANFVEEARSFIGTPYLHQGRVKGEGVDCVGVLIGSAKASGFLPDAYDPGAYDLLNDGALLLNELGVYADQIEYGDAAEGDVIVFRTPDPQHAGVMTVRGDERYVIHALSRKGVVEHRIDERWAKRVESVWRLRGPSE